jgi:Sodium:neurotransmitter symporter family
MDLSARFHPGQHGRRRRDRQYLALFLRGRSERRRRFLIAYILCVLIIGIPLLIAELALGRRGQGDAVAAFVAVAPRSLWVMVGGLGVLAASLILAYYAVIAAWVLKYLVGALLGTLWQAAGEGHDVFFARFIADPLEPIVWQLVSLAATAVIVAAGVRGGIERANRVLMPMLALIVLGLAVYSLSLPGAAGGVHFLLAEIARGLSRRVGAGLLLDRHRHGDFHHLRQLSSSRAADTLSGSQHCLGRHAGRGARGVCHLPGSVRVRPGSARRSAARIRDPATGSSSRCRSVAWSGRCSSSSWSLLR